MSKIIIDIEDARCNNCFYFDGEKGDGTQFCDRKKLEVYEGMYCVDWKQKYYDNENYF